MSRFAPALRRTARELDLPRRVRATLLLEMAADLEAVYAHYRARGLDEEEAERRAEERVLGSPEMLRRLAALHRPSWRGWSEEVGERLGRGSDLLLLAIAVAPMLALAAAVALPILSTSPRSPLVWSVLASGTGVVGIVASRALRLRRGTSGQALRRGLPVLLLLSAVGAALGLLALTLGLRRTALALSGIPTEATGPAAVQAGATHAATEMLVRDGSLLAVGLLVGIAGSIAWFVLMNRASLLEMREVDAVLDGGSAPVPDRRARSVPSLAGRRIRWSRRS